MTPSEATNTLRKRRLYIAIQEFIKLSFSPREFNTGNGKNIRNAYGPDRKIRKTLKITLTNYSPWTKIK